MKCMLCGCDLRMREDDKLQCTKCNAVYKIESIKLVEDAKDEVTSNNEVENTSINEDIRPELREYLNTSDSTDSKVASKSKLEQELDKLSRDGRKEVNRVFGEIYEAAKINESHKNGYDHLNEVDKIIFDKKNLHFKYDNKNLKEFLESFEIKTESKMPQFNYDEADNFIVKSAKKLNQDALEICYRDQCSYIKGYVASKEELRLINDLSTALINQINGEIKYSGKVAAYKELDFFSEVFALCYIKSVYMVLSGSSSGLLVNPIKTLQYVLNSHIFSLIKSIKLNKEYLINSLNLLFCHLFQFYEKVYLDVDYIIESEYYKDFKYEVALRLLRGYYAQSLYVISQYIDESGEIWNKIAKNMKDDVLDERYLNNLIKQVSEDNSLDSTTRAVLNNLIINFKNNFLNFSL